MGGIRVLTALAAVFVTSAGAGEALATPPLKPEVSEAIAYAKSGPARDLARPDPTRVVVGGPGERGGGPVGDRRHSRDGALQRGAGIAAMPPPLFTFEGPSNQDNFNVIGTRVNPPDPVGDVGANQYVAMTNLTWAVYSKTGALLGGPFSLGSIFANLPVPHCRLNNGDPIVFYDEIADRWVLTQFTTQGPEFFLCVAVSTTGDALGTYHLYGFSTGNAFPDYPKWGLWRNAYLSTTREFPSGGGEQVGIYAFDRAEMAAGDPTPRMVKFVLAGPPNLRGNGLLPPDVDGTLPPQNNPIPIVGSQDNGGGTGAAFDALNVFHLVVNFNDPGQSAFALDKQVQIAEYDTIYPCGPDSRDCLPQPGIGNPAQFLDVLSYRQRPLHRLQYRNFGTHEALFTNQSVESRPAQAGVRWWELRNPRVNAVLHQEGTWSPNDGIDRWMGSVAADADGNMAVGYSVVDATDVFPGIRYAGRLAGDPAGQLTQGEAVLRNGSDVQRNVNSRWGDYTSLNVDPVDDCTFYYMNEYYGANVFGPPLTDWRTRIGAFKFPGCAAGK
jgi:hypothetical protein